VLDNERTGLTEQDVFFVGNLIGDTGDGATTLLKVNAADVVATRAAAAATAGASNRFDFNRDGRCQRAGRRNRPGEPGAHSAPALFTAERLGLARKKGAIRSAARGRAPRRS
jgi:hypothetical protein